MKFEFIKKSFRQTTSFIVSYFGAVAKYFNFDYYVKKYYRVDILFMKKVILLITVLFVSVISTACINNLAVQELNNKAKEYMANGETEKAISRLRSSIDLDTSIFETHYNLGVALIANNEFEEAEEALKNAIKLKPDYADSYYSLALAYEGDAFELISKADKSSENQPQESAKKEKQELSAAEKEKIVELFNSAIDNYNIYLTKKADATDKDKITSQIEYLNNQVQLYNALNNNTIEDLRKIPHNEESGDEQ